MNSMVTRWGKVVLQGQGLEEHLTPCLGKKPDLVLFAHVPVIFSSRIFKWLFFIVSFLCHVVIYIFGQCILRCFILLKQIFYLFFLICLFEGERYVWKKHRSVTSYTHPDRGSNPKLFGVQNDPSIHWTTRPGYFSSCSNCPHQVGMNELIYHSPKVAVFQWHFLIQLFHCSLAEVSFSHSSLLFLRTS